MAETEYELFDGNAVRVNAPEEKEETHVAPKKKENLTHITIEQLRKARRSNIKVSSVAVTMCTIGFVAMLLIASIMGQVQINELTKEINSAQKTLTELQSVEIQLKMQESTTFNNEEIRAFVESNLGMDSISSSQTTYINMTNEDSGTVFIDNSKNFIEKFLGLFGFN